MLFSPRKQLWLPCPASLLLASEGYRLPPGGCFRAPCLGTGELVHLFILALSLCDSPAMHHATSSQNGSSLGAALPLTHKCLSILSLCAVKLMIHMQPNPTQLPAWCCNRTGGASTVSHRGVSGPGGLRGVREHLTLAARFSHISLLVLLRSMPDLSSTSPRRPRLGD